MERELQAILFDIDDTLFSTSEFAERARRSAIKNMIRHGLRMDEEAACRELGEVIAEFSSNYSSHFDKLLSRIPRERHWADCNPAILVAAGVIGYHETKSRALEPFPEVARVLRALRAAGLTLGVVSAGLQIKQCEKLIRLGLYPHFDPRAIFISDQIGIGKPNPKLWSTACTQLKVEPRRTMYVGDNPALDIDPCNQLGIVTVRIRRGTRHRAAEGSTPPRYEITSFDELPPILARDFGVSFPG
jgi:putative hydrolase of the HAD superfamily